MTKHIQSMHKDTTVEQLKLKHPEFLALGNKAREEGLQQEELKPELPDMATLDQLPVIDQSVTVQFIDKSAQIATTSVGLGLG